MPLGKKRPLAALLAAKDLKHPVRLLTYMSSPELWAAKYLFLPNGKNCHQVGSYEDVVSHNATNHIGAFAVRQKVISSNLLGSLKFS